MNIAIWVALGGVAIAALTLIYSALKDIRHDAKEDGKTSVILSDIKGSLAKLEDNQISSAAKFELKFGEHEKRFGEHDKKFGELETEIAKVGESTRSAHHRIDELRDEIHSK